MSYSLKILEGEAIRILDEFSDCLTQILLLKVDSIGVKGEQKCRGIKPLVYEILLIKQVDSR